MGIPFTSGPITLFLYLDQGPSFAASAALGSLVGVLATVGFAVAFCVVAKRSGGIGASFLVGLLAFALIGGIAQSLVMAPLVVYAVCAVVLVVAIRLVPDPGPTAAATMPAWDLPARMVLATTLVLAITSGAAALGPRPSGLLATVPLYAGILAAFGFTLVGPRAAIRVWRGLLFGLFGFGAFYLVIASGVEPLGLAAFGFALLTTIAIQSVTLRLLRSGGRGRDAAVGM